MNKYMRKSMKTGCYDNTGQKRKHQDTWVVNDCRTCTCRVSTLTWTCNYSDAFDEDLYKQVLMSSPLHFGIIKYCLNILKTTSNSVYISVILFVFWFKKNSVICCVDFKISCRLIRVCPINLLIQPPSPRPWNLCTNILPFCAVFNSVCIVWIPTSKFYPEMQWLKLLSKITFFF